MKILVIGSGGREHALAWKLAQSPRVSEVIVAPGNAGTATEGKCRNVAIKVTDIEGLLKLAQDEAVGLTVVGPEVPLVLGVVDRFRQAGLRIFGPTAAAAQLEGSKAFAKDFLARHGIPTAYYAVHTEVDSALAYLHEKGAPIVIKADGLAAGKGVVVAATLEEAHAAVDAMLGDGSMGEAGARVVIEECLVGEEASFIVMCDGRNVLALATSQDHKRLQDGDQGPNTGGMGAYSPAPIVTPELHHRIMREIILPTVQGMARDGLPYTGFLYAGLMIAPGDDPDREIKTLEFNCRMGDPETQPIMARLKTDLLDVFLVRGIDDRGDVEVGLAVPAREVDLAEHAGRVLVTLLDGVEVTDVGLGEVDSGLLSAADSDSVDVGRARVGGEVDGADLIVKGPESDLASADSGGERGNEAEGGSREMHGEIVFVTKKKKSVNLVTCAEWTQREDMNVV